MKNILRIFGISIILFAATILPGITAAFSLSPLLYFAAGAVFAAANIIPSPGRILPIRCKAEKGGAVLLSSFLILAVLEIIYIIIGAIHFFGWFTAVFWINTAVMAVSEFIIFWNGIIRIYVTSSMLGINRRIIGILCGMIPIVNIIVLLHIIKIAFSETNMEERRIINNENRKNKAVCKTKYPIVLVHGVFFRDLEKFNYWGRIPTELQKNGAEIFYGNQQSSISIKDSAIEIAGRIQEILKQTGSEKVNIIAHSKGGLDCRYAISCLGMDKYTASLTTINTPHRGCVFAEWLLSHAPEGLKNEIADKYNKAFLKLGDTRTDFIGAVTDLTAEKCEIFNKEVKNSPLVYYQSTGSKINTVMTSIFPLNFSHILASYFDGANDGLVSAKSSEWGENFIFLESKCPDGISHADVIDLMRHDKPDFDVREFYVGLVSGLREKGF